ncbi:BlaI/MecI/CopY family transcriptional regulator [Planctomycetota bacterium]
MKESSQGKRGRRKKRIAELTEAEWTIMEVVWEHQPCAAGTVQEALTSTKDWSYATVKITMDRMKKKDFLEVTKVRNLQLFSATIDKVAARRGELHSMLKRAFDGALTPMVQFLVDHEGISPEDAQRLRELADKAEKQEGD